MHGGGGGARVRHGRGHAIHAGRNALPLLKAPTRPTKSRLSKNNAWVLAPSTTQQLLPPPRRPTPFTSPARHNVTSCLCTTRSHRRRQPVNVIPPKTGPQMLLGCCSPTTLCPAARDGPLSPRQRYTRHHVPARKQPPPPPPNECRLCTPQRSPPHSVVRTDH